VKFKVTAPVADFDGKTGDVNFSAGIAIIDDEANPMELAYCRTAGYSVEPVEEPAPAKTPRKAPAKPAAKTDEKPPADEKPADNDNKEGAEHK
jgi:hypothetical protein